PPTSPELVAHMKSETRYAIFESLVSAAREGRTVSKVASGRVDTADLLSCFVNDRTDDERLSALYWSPHTMSRRELANRSDHRQLRGQDHQGPIDDALGDERDDGHRRACDRGERTGSRSCGAPIRS